MNYIKLSKEVKLWNAGYVQMWNFSKANSCEEARIEAITTVANVCRGNKGVKNPKELYQRLLTEHDGKPGSVFEFVPVELNDKYGDNVNRFGVTDQIEVLFIGAINITSTNLRACIADKLNQYNGCIEDFFVFKIKVPQMIVKHILRHRMLSFQEMSERTNKLREYYYCDDFKQILDEVRCNFLEKHKDISDYELWNNICYQASQQAWDVWQNGFSIDTGESNGNKIRQELTNKGSHGLAYTTLWIAGWKQDPNGWDNFFAVRTKKPAQKEIIELANTIKQMMEEWC